MDGTELLEPYTHLSIARLPLWIVVVGVLLALPLASFLGHRLGRSFAQRPQAPGAPSTPPSDTMLAALLGLLGLLLAFTYAFSLSRADARKHALSEEAAAIGTAFLRADLLSEPGRSNLQNELLDYAESRNSTAKTHKAILADLQSSLEEQAALWPAALAAIDSEARPIAVFVASGITDVLDAHTRRVAAASDRIPGPVLFLLLIASFVALTVAGNHSALQGRPLSWRRYIFALTLAAVILVIFDFERPHEGLIRVNDDALRATLKDMQNAMADRTHQGIRSK